MKQTIAITGLIFLLTACAGPTQTADEGKYEAYCKTHARKVSYSGSPDENIPYLKCMHIKGRHDVEVTELDAME